MEALEEKESKRIQIGFVPPVLSSGVAASLVLLRRAAKNRTGAEGVVSKKVLMRLAADHMSERFSVKVLLQRP